MATVSSTETATFFRQAFSLHSHKPVRLTLAVSAGLHATEFIICTILFFQFSTPFFVAPVAALLDGKESVLYAHSIIRQYGFFAIQLALLALFVATNPAAYSSVIRALALARLLMAGLGIYAFAQHALTLNQLLLPLVVDVVLAVMLLRYAPAQPTNSAEAELSQFSEKILLGVRLTPRVQRLSLQLLCIVTGGLWMLWGLGSTVFWEIGVANISSDASVEMNLLNAMQANHIVRNQQGVMLFGIGVSVVIGAFFPLSQTRIIEFVMAQQVINAVSAGVELFFGAIAIGQFFTVFSVQVATVLLFYALYPKATDAILSNTMSK